MKEERDVDRRGGGWEIEGEEERKGVRLTVGKKFFVMTSF
jgi:hypothetical protein